MDHLPSDGNDKFGAQILSSGEEFSAALRLEDHLGDAIAIAQIDEDEHSMIPVGIHPAVEDHRLPDLGLSELTTGMRSPQSHHNTFLLWNLRRFGSIAAAHQRPPARAEPDPFR